MKHPVQLYVPQLTLFSFLFASLFSPLITSLYALDIPITLHESASAGAITKEPINMVFPIPNGVMKDPQGLILVDDAGKSIPAQFSALTHWYGNGEFIQHLLVNSEVDLPSGGKRIFHLKEGMTPPPDTSVLAIDDSTSITVNTGAIKFIVLKKGFNLFDQVWVNSQKIIVHDANSGGVLTKKDGTKQLDMANTLLTASIEENGPIRVVLQLFALSAYKNKTDFTHGFRCRIYAYAGKPWVKVDYALRNTPHADSKQPAGPMYFKDFSLEQTLSLGPKTTTQVATGNDVTDITSDSIVSASDSGLQIPGWIDVSENGFGVMASIRHFWQQYPMQTEYSATAKKLKLSFWPEGFQDYYYPQGNDGGRALAQIFWLDDGMQKTHQVCFYFHAKTVSQSELMKRAALFERYPIAQIEPTEWAKSRSLPDDGYIDPKTTGIYSPRKNIVYGKYDFNGETDRRLTNGTGGLPTSLLPFIVNGDPKTYFEWEPFYLMETDVRYTHMDNLMLSSGDAKMDLYTKQYGGTHYKDPFPWVKNADAAYDTGTGKRFGAWDVQHMWIYPFYEMYLMNGDYRIKDFYQELGGFMAYEISVEEPLWVKIYKGVPPINARGTAHPLAAVNLAFRCTGNPIFRKAAADYVDRIFTWYDHQDGSWLHDETVPFMEGFLARSLINFIQDSPPSEELQKQKAISVIAAFNDADMRSAWANGKGFGYTHPDTATTPPASASVSSVTMGDATAWLYLKTGASKYKDSLHIFMKSFPEYFTNWSGDYTGRTTTYMDQVGIADSTIPPSITDLTVTPESKLKFTSKGGAGFVVRWYGKSITDTYYSDFNSDTTSQISWWAAQVSPSLAVPVAAGGSQEISLYDVPVGTAVHVMIKTVGSNGVWSKGSNDATVTITQTLKNTVELKPSKLVPAKNSFRITSTAFGKVCQYISSLPTNEKIVFQIFNLRGQQIQFSNAITPNANGQYEWFIGREVSGACIIKVISSQRSEFIHAVL